MAIKKRPVSPRQKMINLMYVVLMAMLALNVSTEVLNGFSIVEESLKRTTQNSTLENLAIYDDFAVQMKQNPQKVKQWYDKSQQVKKMSDALYNLADELKEAIVKEADGKNGDVQNIRNKEDMEAVAKEIREKYGCAAVLCKGGHRINDANDLLYDGKELVWFTGKRIDNPNTHGTGCTLSSAIASGLAKGYDMQTAVRSAKNYISGALAAMLDLGKGSGPMNHAFAIDGDFRNV